MLSKSPASYIIELKYKLAIRHCFDIIAPKNIWQKWRDIKDMQENVRIIFKDNIKVVEINTIKFSGKRKIDWDGIEGKFILLCL